MNIQVAALTVSEKSSNWALKCTHKVTRPVIYKSMSAVLINSIYTFGIKHVQSRVKSNSMKLISLDSDAFFYKNCIL